ncbi:ATP-dependent helicase, partial [Listeria monocytogenes]|nr:ATP-dependent helicase [Listeria monocytogenes]
ETRSLYKSVKSLENIIWINIDDTSSWEQQVLKEIDNDQSSALLRFRVVSAKEGASALSTFGLNYVFIPQLPIADITTETSWLYSAISKFCILEHYSVYDLVSDIPVEADESKKNINKINIILKEVETNAGDLDEDNFNTSVKKLADYLNYSISNEHLSKLYETITDNSYHVAFEQEKYKHLAITFHSSKGLEFDQVILFSEDYR